MNNYSYITLLSDDSYIYGIILLNESLKKVKSEYPLYVLVTSNVTPPIINILDQLSLEYKIIEPIQYEHIANYNKKSNPSMANVWALCLSKLNIFNMIEMDKWVFLDADIMIMKNIDHLFDYPHLTSALDGEYFNLWPGWDHFNSGILVIEPNEEEYKKIQDFIINDALNEEWRPGECIADQEILNHYYKDWVNQPQLHLNKYYDMFAPYIQESQIDDVDQNCYFIHFVGRKPWRAFYKQEIETYTEKYYEIARKMIQDAITSISWDQVKDQIKIAIYSICKNEMNNIHKFLNCFSIADYICILDTGSTDGTWEYLQEIQKKYPNLIIDQKIIDPWRYDTARNLSLELVPKDTTVFFMMDLDEVIKQKDWMYQIKAYWDPLFSRGEYIYHRAVDINTDTPILTFLEHRIHSNKWKYHGLIHEQLVNPGGQRNFYSDECISIPITVWHYPINLHEKNYIDLCERAVQEEPENWLMHLQLAIEYEVHLQYDKAINEYRKIIIEENSLDKFELGRCYASLGRLLNITGQPEAGLRVLHKGIEAVPKNSDNYFLAAEIYYQQHEFEKTYQFCQAGLENGIQGQWCTIINKEGYFPNLLLGLSLYYMGEQILGLGYLALAKEQNNNEETNNIFNQIIFNIMNGR